MPRTAPHKEIAVRDILVRTARTLGILGGSEQMTVRMGRNILDGLRRGVERLNMDPLMSEPRLSTWDVSQIMAEGPEAEEIVVPWGPDVEAGHGIIGYPPTNIIQLWNDYILLEPYTPEQYIRRRESSISTDSRGYWHEKTWPTHKLHFPGGLYEGKLEVMSRHMIEIVEDDRVALEANEAGNVDDDGMARYALLNLPPGYGDLLLYETCLSVAPEYQAMVPAELRRIAMVVSENISNRNQVQHSLSNSYADLDWEGSAWIDNDDAASGRIFTEF